MEFTRDAILYGELMLWQPEKGPRVSVDSVLLTAFSQVRPGERVLELGSAHGAVALLLARRFPESGSVEGLEIQPELVEVARKNARENGLEGRVAFRRGDLRQVRNIYPPQSFQVVVMNPPYDEPGKSRPSPHDAEATARHGLHCSLQDVVQAARYLIANRGRLFMVFRANRTAELCRILEESAIEPKRIRPVHPSPEKDASVVLVEGVRAGGVGVTIQPPLFIHDKNGDYTPSLLAAYSVGGGSCL